MRQNHLLYIIICFQVAGFLCGHSIEAQAFQTEYARYLSEIRNGTNPALPDTLVNSGKAIPRLIPLIEQNLTDTLPDVRKACYHMLHIAQQKTRDPSTKRAILRTQLKGLKDEVPDICGFTIKNISRLPSTLFDERQKVLLAGLIGRKIPNKPVLMKMVGSLDIRESIPALQRLALPGNPSEIRWAAFMALSRMGDEDAISYTDHRLRNLSSHMVVNLVPSVIYTRQKQLYDYLVELLYNNNQNCGSFQLEQKNPSNCAYEILEGLASAIVDFPIRITPSGDLDAKDYQIALETAREWFTKNPDYRIIASNN